ncbi:MAG: TylF/MycF family methyltransferase [Candidatus Eremiobacteraeota bacterium]|nr:TylF/MycF family methyltransferase [Candidatus Eremiobacteraeota bacterium]
MHFDDSPCPTEKKLANFPKYIRRQTMARTLVQYEIFKRQVSVKGCVVECGVHHGGGVMAWAQFSAILEPYNYRRKIIGFDTFEGFPDVSDVDKTRPVVQAGMFKEDYNVLEELGASVQAFDENRFLNHIPKVQLVQGDANETIPAYIQSNPWLVVSLLYLDFDIYKPTATALEHLIPRMPVGAIIAFDEVCNENWPGETQALIESLELNHHRLECFPFEPNISFIQLQ